MKEVEDYNAKVRASPFEGLTFITPAAIKATITRMKSPPKREKIRAGLAEINDPGAFNIDVIDLDTGKAKKRTRTRERSRSRERTRER